MKKVLILAYDFPPYVSVGGLRPYSWYKYLKEFGVEPIVITRHWGDIKNEFDYYKTTKNKRVEIINDTKGTIIRVPYKANCRDKILITYGLNKLVILRRILSFITAISEFGYGVLDSRKAIYKEAQSFLETTKVDFIIATGEPFVLFKYAHRLSKQNGIPWIADYRDGWTNNYSKVFKTKKKTLSDIFFENRERKYLQNVSIVTTVSEPLKKELKKKLNKKTMLLQNGYDAEIFQSIDTTKSNQDYLKIAYLGTIYPHQRLETFLDGYRKFINNNPEAKIKVVFYGLNNSSSQLSRLKRFDPILFNEYIESTERMPQQTVLEKISDSHLLLLLANPHIDGSAAKIYDYLALGKKILLVENDHSSLEQIINYTKSGIICDTAEQVFLALENNYSEWLSTKNILHQTINTEQYSRKYQTKELTEIMNLILSSKNHTTCLNCNSKKLNKLSGYEKDYLVKCKDCGLVFSQKTPIHEELIQYYEDTYTRDDYLSPITVKRYNEVLDVFEKYRKTNKLLDLGSGVGYFLEVAKQRGWEVYGTEFTDDAMAICKNKGAIMHQGSLNEQNYKAEMFDLITSFEVIEHINNPSEELPIYYKLLRKGGAIYFTTPNFNSIERYILKGQYSAIKYPEHLTYYTKSTIDKLFQKHGFSKQKLETVGFSLSRIKHSLKHQGNFKVSKTYDDEKIRQEFEKSKFLRFSKLVINSFLNFFSVGNSLKGLYLKH